MMIPKISLTCVGDEVEIVYIVKARGSERWDKKSERVVPREK